MNTFVYCFNRNRIGKGIGQARAVAVCRKLECPHITELNECMFKSAEEKKVLAAGKMAAQKKAGRTGEPENATE